MSILRLFFSWLSGEGPLGLFAPDPNQEHT